MAVSQGLTPRRLQSLAIASALVVAYAFGCGGDDGPPNSGGVVVVNDQPETGPVLTTREPTCEDGVPLPTDLRCTGLYADFTTRQIRPEAREYAPALAFFSDHATKRRWLYLPPGTKIDTANMDDWVFPPGTKVWKEFTVEGKVVETRLFVKKDDGEWAFTTYVWNEDQSAATRLDSGKKNAVGTYEIPSVVHCSQCHNGHGDRLLGVEAVLLSMQGASGLDLTTMKAQGLLTQPPATTTLTLPGDERAQKALGYLHANCGIACHSPLAAGTSNFTGLHLRLSAKQLFAGGATVAQTDTYATALNKPIVATMYLDDARFTAHKRLVPKSPDTSLVLAVVQANDTASMPPILRHAVDDTGVSLLRDWIQNLP